MLTQRRGALARAVRDERIDVILCHSVLQHLMNADIRKVLRSFGEVAAQQLAQQRESASFAAANGAAALAATPVYLIADNQPEDTHHSINDDATLAAAVAKAGGLRNATHRVSLVDEPFNLDPLEGRQRIVGRLPANGGGRLEYTMEFLRVFRAEPEWAQ